MKRIISLLALALIFQMQAQETENLATKLGHPANAKLLIIHADDLGVSHAENKASIEAIEKGSVNSASVMMPTPWVLEAANYAKDHPDTHDFGLHLVLSSEWKNYRWGPVASNNEVNSLLGEHGYFHSDCQTELRPEEVEKELVAQIERAYAMGLSPTHLDTHMGCLIQTNELLEIYLKMGQKYKLPVLASKDLPKELQEKYGVKVLVDEIMTILPEQFAEGPEKYYTEAIKNLKPGLSTFLIHTAYDNEEMKAMNVDHPDWGNVWRQKDFDYFTSKACADLLKSEGIVLVTWRELKAAYYD